MSKFQERIQTAREVSRHYSAIESMIKVWGRDDLSTIDAMELLAKLEKSVTRANLRECNEANFNASPARQQARKMILDMFPHMPPTTLEINCDPRGYALKIEDEYLRQHLNADGMAHLGLLQTDFGGYGLLCPECVSK
jgi:hypothetical protein